MRGLSVVFGLVLLVHFVGCQRRPKTPDEEEREEEDREAREQAREEGAKETSRVLKGLGKALKESSQSRGECTNRRDCPTGYFCLVSKNDVGTCMKPN